MAKVTEQFNKHCRDIKVEETCMSMMCEGFSKFLKQIEGFDEDADFVAVSIRIRDLNNYIQNQIANFADNMDFRSILSAEMKTLSYAESVDVKHLDSVLGSDLKDLAESMDLYVEYIKRTPVSKRGYSITKVMGRLDSFFNK